MGRLSRAFLPLALVSAIAFVPQARPASAAAEERGAKAVSAGSQAKLEIFGVGGVPASFKARPNAPLDLTVNVSVRNAGPQAAAYSMVALVREGTGTSRAGPLRLEPGATARTSLRIQSAIGNVYVQGEKMAVVIRLIGTDGRQLAEHSIMIPFENTKASTTPPPAAGQAPRVAAARVARTTAEPNLELVSAGASRVGAKPIDRYIGGPTYSVGVTVRNTQAGGVWGYRGEIRWAFYEGTPEASLTLLRGLTGEHPFGGGIQPGQSRSFKVVSETVPVDVRYAHFMTLYVSIVSEADAHDDDNALYVVFTNTGGRVNVERSLWAPAARPHADVKRPPGAK